MTGSCVTFTIMDSTGSIFLSMPNWDGEINSSNLNSDNFNFVSGDYEVRITDINNESLTLQGIEVIDQTSWRICLPICFNDFGRICFKSSDVGRKFGFLNDAMNNHREIIISGLNNEIDAIYTIKSFGYRYIEKSKDAFEWILNLEYVKESV